MRKKSLLLCTVSGFFLCSYYSTSYAQNGGKQIRSASTVIADSSSHGQQLSRTQQVQRSVDNPYKQTINARNAIRVDGSSPSSPKTETIIGKDVSGFYALDATNATINGENIRVTGGQVGLLVSDGKINLKDSLVTVERGAGITFFSYKTRTYTEDNNVVKFFNTKLFVKGGMGILGPSANGTVFLKNSEIDADVLVKNRVRRGDNIGTLTLIADHSILKGGTRILKRNDIEILKRKNIETLKQNNIEISKQNNIDEAEAQLIRAHDMSVKIDPTSSSGYNALRGQENLKNYYVLQSVKNVRSTQNNNNNSYNYNNPNSLKAIQAFRVIEAEKAIEAEKNRARAKAEAIEEAKKRAAEARKAIQARYTSDQRDAQGTLRQKTVLYLNNGSKWILRVSKTETDDRDKMLGPVPKAFILDIAQRAHSDISVLHVDNSSIIFESPTEGHYQTLYVGAGNAETQKVYNAGSNAKLYLNTNGRKADRLFVNGDVSGSTTVHVNIQGNISNTTNLLFLTGSLPLNKRGISLIQVVGQATENSFKLAKGYMTVSGSPYKYTLNAYGPTSRNGLADINQRFFNVNSYNNAFWDFRLQNQYLPNSNVKALLPQMASYLVMPNALFTAGFTDIENQNALLTNIRPMPWEMKNDKKLFFFISSYGNKATLSSNRTALEYGYDADIGYAALQTGVALAALEGQNTSSYFGLLGTYGKLSFTPQNIADVKKSTFDKWLFTAYSSIQHDSGVYINTFLSYGLFRGNISNAIIGQTARVDDAKTWSASATLGKQLVTSIEDLVFEPQTQIAYQQLMFNTIQDTDKFKVDMSNPYQWSIRMGGRLVKNVNQFEDGRTLSFYGKLNLISVFGDGGTVQVGKKSFYFDPIGPAIEGGIGVNAELIQNVTFHGDVSYQQKLQKAGLSGAIFSGTLRYRF
ncbi:autotransporter outer membrane beta-barrel domain-containing protein [Bartonella schoenbuchensis]|uniref:Inducible Bartonella autotransporter n=1 Tax=Bartonella schoenbuchensis m07a TaxID=1094496 RepID=N6V9Q3_9HYPH|nr:autotransporter outer membrane beta-barrel domain-containing protein [Bartonella schoenbuchensis]ENN90530.1 Inducible Bartonella autotransporter [Bartonella schoenbuchensis m07a]